MTENRNDQRPLRLGSMLALGINGIVGVGIFFVPSIVAAEVPGTAGLSVYVVTLAACVPIALVFAKLGGRFDEDGGPYVYARAAFGDGTAFAVGWIAYVAALFSTGTVIVGFVEAASSSLEATGVASLGAGGRAAAGAALASVLALILASGLRLSARLWSTITVCKLLPLIALLAAAGISRAPAAAAPAPAALGDPFAAALALVFALQGFEIVPLPAAQVERSERVVPFATVMSLLGAGALYFALHLACLRALPDLAAHHDAPLADAAVAYGGPWLGKVVRSGMLISSFGIAVGMMAMTPRYLAALGPSEGLGARLSAMNARGTPTYAFAITWALVLAIVVASSLASSLSELFALSSIAVLFQYLVTAAALGWLCWRGRNGLTPRDIWPVPLALVGSALLVRGARAAEIVWIVAAAACGFAVRWWASRASRRADRSQP